MEKSLKHDLTAKQEKLLASFDLNEAQRAKVREVWETEKIAGKFNLVVYGSYLLMLLLIAGLASQFFHPDERIANLAIFYTWIYYPLSILMIMVLHLVLLIIQAGFLGNKDKTLDQRPKNFDQMEKNYYRTNLNRNSMMTWAGRKTMAKVFSLLANITVCVLLVMNGHFISALTVVTNLIMVHFFLVLAIKITTQNVLDRLKNQTFATDQNGQVIEVEVLPKALN